MSTSQEQLQEIVSAQEFIDTVGSDPRFANLLTELKYALALDRQEIKSSFRVVAETR